MTWKKAKVVWKGQACTRHFIRETLQDANFKKIENLPEGTVAWKLRNEDAANALDVSFQAELDSVRADFTFFTLDAAGVSSSWTGEESSPSAIYLRRHNAAGQIYYFEAIVPGWSAEDEKDG